MDNIHGHKHGDTLIVKVHCKVQYKLCNYTSCSHGYSHLQTHASLEVAWGRLPLFFEIYFAKVVQELHSAPIACMGETSYEGLNMSRGGFNLVTSPV